MEFVHGLKLDISSVNQILKIAQEKGYLINEEFITTCDSFRFDEENQIFEFRLKATINLIKLGKDDFIECFTELLKR